MWNMSDVFAGLTARKKMVMNYLMNVITTMHKRTMDKVKSLIPNHIHVKTMRHQLTIAMTRWKHRCNDWWLPWWIIQPLTLSIIHQDQCECTNSQIRAPWLKGLLVASPGTVITLVFFPLTQASGSFPRTPNSCDRVKPIFANDSRKPTWAMGKTWVSHRGLSWLHCNHASVCKPEMQKASLNDPSSKQFLGTQTAAEAETGPCFRNHVVLHRMGSSMIIQNKVT